MDSSSDSESSGERHYVILVHGTWNAPDGTETKWYEPGGAFADELARQLEKGPLTGSLFRTVGDQRLVFAWSGHNTHAARLEAAERLAKALYAVRRIDPNAVFSFVSHSHGGNVVVKALEIYFDILYKEARGTGECYIQELAKRADVVAASGCDLATRKDILSEALARGYWPHRTAEFLQAHSSAIDVAAQLLAGVTESWIRQQTHQRWRWLPRHGSSGLSPAAVRAAGDRIAIPWCSYADSHRIRRLVFIGTPFLHKRWRTSLFWRWMASVIAGILLPATAGFYALISTVAVIVFHTSRALNPWFWPWWTSVLYVAFAIVCVVVAFWINSLGPPVPARRDVNFYFDIQNSPLRLDGRHTSLDALVISAGQYDEALLALSAEPIVQAHVTPQIDALLTPIWWRGPRQPPAGIARVSLLERFSSIGTVPVRLIYGVIGLAKNASLVLLRPVLKPFLKETFRRVVSATGSGLSATEFREAYLSAAAEINVPEVFHEYKWDVSRLLATRERTKNQPNREASRYEYLWSFDRLLAVAQTSEVWAKLEPYLGEFVNRVRADDRNAERVRLARLCVTIEEKIRELGGAIHLAHSEYYGDPLIIAAIARFLERGELPADCDQLKVVRYDPSSGPAGLQSWVVTKR